jgi:hypothetical protein
MSELEPMFDLKSNKIYYSQMSLLDDDNISEASIVAGYADDSTEYDEKNIVSVKIEIDIPVEEFRFQLSLITEIEMLNKKGLSFEEMIKNERNEFLKPGLGKASLIISQLCEAASGFPNVYNLTEMLKEQNEENA